ncbi:MAG TPA: CopG family antitoxin [Blastocatellia bacterium]|nr:CopG family antitoxin [Blastocatellia bacterium]
MPRSKAKSMPTFESTTELVDFFDTHDLGEYWENLPEAKLDIDIRKRRHLVAINEELMKRVSEIAKSKRMPAERLINRWLEEKVLNTP